MSVFSVAATMLAILTALFLGRLGPKITEGLIVLCFTVFGATSE